MESYAVLCLDDMRIGLPLTCVELTTRSVSVTRLPAAPEIVLGVVNVRGRVAPVVDMRRRFHLPPRDIGLNDRLVIAHTSRRRVALVVDAVSGILECEDADIASAESILPGLEFIAGVARRDDGLILIHDLDHFLSLEEDDTLSRVLETGGDP